MAWPSSLAAMLFASADVVDTAMLGWVGVSDMAGAALGTTVLAVIIAFPSGVCTAMAALAASTPRRPSDLRAVTRVGVVLAVSLGVLTTALAVAAGPLLSRAGLPSDLLDSCSRFLLWRAPALPLELLFVALWAELEGLSKTRPPLLAGAVFVAVNLGLCGLLVPGWLFASLGGVRGAALAANLALVVGLGVLVVAVLRLPRSTAEPLRPAEAAASMLGSGAEASTSPPAATGPTARETGHPSAPLDAAGGGGHDRQTSARWLLRRLWRVGWPLGATSLLDLTGGVVLAVLLARLGTVASAGHAIASKLILLGTSAAQGLGVAALAVVAGARSHRTRPSTAGRRAQAVFVMQGISAGAVAAVALLMLNPWATLFGADPAVRGQVDGLLPVLGLIIIADGFSLVTGRMLEGLSVTRTVLTATALCDVALGLPAAFLAGERMGLLGCYAVWLARAALKTAYMARRLPEELRPTARRLRALAAAVLSPPVAAGAAPVPATTTGIRVTAGPYRRAPVERLEGVSTPARTRRAVDRERSHHPRQPWRVAVATMRWRGMRWARRRGTEGAPHRLWELPPPHT